MTPLFVGVEWDDAHGSSADEVSVSDLGQHHRACVLTTFGFLLLFDESGISLASEQDKDKNYRGLTFIPRANVRAIWRVAARPFVRRNTLYLREESISVVEV